jgi:hypothetical protein
MKLKRVKIKWLSLIFLSALLLSGCAASDQYVRFPDQSKTVENPHQGRIYVIRPGMTGLGIASDISDDGEAIGSTRRRGFLCWERPPGRTTVIAKTDNTAFITVDVKVGEAVYILQTLHFGWTETDNRLDQIAELEAREDLKLCTPPFDYTSNSVPVMKP